MDCEDDLSRSAGDSPVQEDLRIDDPQDLGEEQNGSANNLDSNDICFTSINDNCSTACWCRQMRQWLSRQFDRNLDILTIDTYYRLNNQNLDEEEIENCKIQNSNSNLDPLPTLSGVSYNFAGPKNRTGKPHGHCSLYFPNGRKFNGEFQHGRREGDGILHDKDGGLVLTGSYVDDKLHGIAHIISGSDGSFLEVVFVRGVAHGPARRFSASGQLTWVGRYRFGAPFGLCWKSGDGRGWLCGQSDSLGRITDTNAIYLYPNLHSALQGEWFEDRMKIAKFVNAVGFHIVEGFPLPNAIPSDDKSVYTFDVSSFDKISSTPLLRDPYEAICVACKTSKLQNGGQGIFALRDFPANSIVAFYNGVRFNDCHAFNDWDNNCYKIRLSEKKKQILDIPVESQRLENYCATLAHKINHSFTPNAKFVDYHHPRFGRIVAVKTSCAVTKGSELFCHYGYNPLDSPAWYKVLYDANCS